MYTIDNNLYTLWRIMLSYIISSSARIKLLKIFMMNPTNRYYIRQISKTTNVPIQAVQRETLKLYEAGILSREKDGNRVYFIVNKDFFLFNELKNIIIKTVGVGDKLRESITDQTNITFSFIYGSYAKNEENTKSDIDIAVIGNIHSKDLIETISIIQNEIGREINPYVITINEFKERLRRKEHFIVSLLKTPKIFIKGSEDEFRRTIESK